MIATISSVNIHYHIQLQFLFLVMRTFKIYSLSNFQICKTVCLTIVTILYITFPRLIYLITGRLYLLITFTSFTHLPPRIL